MTEEMLHLVRTRNRIKGVVLSTIAARLDVLPLDELEGEMAAVENGLEVRVRFIPTAEVTP
jgi:hypothetical protein